VLLSINRVPPYGGGDLWPLILIAVGVLMLTDRLFGPGMAGPLEATGPRTGPTSSIARQQAERIRVFWAQARITDPDFPGGKVECVFGVSRSTCPEPPCRIYAVLKLDRYSAVRTSKVRRWEVVMKGRASLAVSRTDAAPRSQPEPHQAADRQGRADLAA